MLLRLQTRHCVRREQCRKAFVFTLATAEGALIQKRGRLQTHISKASLYILNNPFSSETALAAAAAVVPFYPNLRCIIYHPRS